MSLTFLSPVSAFCLTKISVLILCCVLFQRSIYGYDSIIANCSSYSISGTSNSASNTYSSCNFTTCGGNLIEIYTGVLSPYTPTCATDTYIRLFNSTNNEVAYNDDYSSSGCSFISYSPPSDSACQLYTLHEGCYSNSICSGQFLIAETFLTAIPTISPTFKPSNSKRPTRSPTTLPTTSNPSVLPTQFPTEQPSEQPSDLPTMLPTERPSFKPTLRPTLQPTANPTLNPSSLPTIRPTSAPTTKPSRNPTVVPTVNPTISTFKSCGTGVCCNNTVDVFAYSDITYCCNSGGHEFVVLNNNITSCRCIGSIPMSCSKLTYNPTLLPTCSPTILPTLPPSANPSANPTLMPTNIPTTLPSSHPTFSPTYPPSNIPTITPTSYTPSHSPTASTDSPTILPSESPSLMPTSPPSLPPTLDPSQNPTLDPSMQPTAEPKIITQSIDNSTINTSSLSGVVIGVFFAGCLIAATAVYCLCARKNKKNDNLRHGVSGRQQQPPPRGQQPSAVTGMSPGRVTMDQMYGNSKALSDFQVDNPSMIPRENFSVVPTAAPITYTKL